MTSEARPPASAPDAASPAAEALRETIKQSFGFIPNAVEEMLISPAVTSLVLSAKKLMATASLSSKEQSAIELFIAVRSDCAYCRTWHEGLGLRAGFPPEEMRRIIAGHPPADDRLRRLLWVTQLIMTHGGRISSADREQLLGAGIDRRQLFEIIALVGLNVITNAINIFAGTPPDERFVGMLDRAGHAD
jgi:alkylhydroperoxidase family enzyme